MALKWNVQIIEELIKRGKNHYSIASGFSPSGWMHLGTLREVTIASFINFILSKNFAKKSTIRIFIDDMDPLLKIPVEWNLPESAKMKPHYKLPQLYPEYHHIWNELKNQLNTLSNWFPEAELVYMSSVYFAGGMNESILKAISNSKKITSYVKKELSENTDWMPVYGFNPKDDSPIKRGKYKSNILYCDEGELDLLNGGSKLAWKVDWPARWALYGVDFEPLGKDVASALNASRWISREIYSYNPPELFTFEYITTETGKKISKSVGGSSSTKEIAFFTPIWNLKHWLLHRPTAALTLKMNKLVKNFEKIILDINNFHGLSEERKKFSPIPYIFKNNIPYFPKNLNLLHLFRIFTWIAPDNEEDLIHQSSFFLKAEDENFNLSDEITELIKKSYLYWESIREKFFSIFELQTKDLKILSRLIDILKLNVNDSFLIKSLTEKKEVRKIVYLVLNGSKDGGPALKLIIELLGRSRIISMFDNALNSKWIKELNWENVKIFLEH